jgi:hypothetical protein
MNDFKKFDLTRYVPVIYTNGSGAIDMSARPGPDPQPTTFYTNRTDPYQCVSRGNLTNPATWTAVDR